jgi:hypothetical protein
MVIPWRGIDPILFGRSLDRERRLLRPELLLAVSLTDFGGELLPAQGGEVLVEDLVQGLGGPRGGADRRPEQTRSAALLFETFIEPPPGWWSRRRRFGGCRPIGGRVPAGECPDSGKIRRNSPSLSALEPSKAWGRNPGATIRT